MELGECATFAQGAGLCRMTVRYCQKFHEKERDDSTTRPAAGGPGGTEVPRGPRMFLLGTRVYA